MYRCPECSFEHTTGGECHCGDSFIPPKHIVMVEIEENPVSPYDEDD